MENHINSFAGHLASCWAGQFQHSYSICSDKGKWSRKTWSMWVDHEAYTGDLNWSCANLREASQRYSWSEGRFKVPTLKKNLQKAIRSNNDQEAKAVCEDILRWGGVYRPKSPTQTWLNAQTSKERLCTSIQHAVERLQPTSSVSLDPFLEDIPFNSATTKIFAFAGQNESIAIYDSRVGAALCLIARDFLEMKEAEQVPVELDFRWLDKKDDSKGTRNPSKGKYKFSRMPYSTKTASHKKAEISRRINQVILEARTLLAAQGESYDVATEEIEQALFMIGYDVSRETSASNPNRPRRLR